MAVGEGKTVDYQKMNDDDTTNQDETAFLPNPFDEPSIQHDVEAENIRSSSSRTSVFFQQDMSTFW